jgi:SEC-C motif-containing protein
MRSRYSAYCLGDEAYLLKTWHASTRPESLNLADNPVKWIGLEIIAAPDYQGDEATVEFVARFKQNGRAGRLHENSRFRRDRMQWFYLDGTPGDR